MVCLFVQLLGGTIGSLHGTGRVSDVKCLRMPPPLASQSVLKHTATAAVVAAAAAALDLSEKRILQGINSVFVLTSTPAASKKFLWGQLKGRNGGKMSAVCRRRRTVAE